ncbi:MAG: hypothetical protein QOD53_1710, partial [Thermoleophilaceae bacterium]|nr:hypothetical protein [Thermoleophilaceae bacterium]
DPDDPDALASAALSAATDGRVRAELVEAGLLRAKELTWDRAAAATDALIDRLLLR